MTTGDEPPSNGPRPATDRFVVGTGRCGSTLLTRALSLHRNLLGINEVFTGLDWGERFAAGDVPGSRAAEVLARPNPVISAVTARGHRAPEVTYPFRPTDRWAPGDQIPWILTSTLGHLSDDPDAAWDVLERWLSTRGPAPLATHYRALFDRLAAEAGRPAWVERSGSSVDYVGELLGAFRAAPDDAGAHRELRVVHLHRDGVEVALSMKRHPFYRLAVQLLYGYDPPGLADRGDAPDGSAADDGALDEEALFDAWLDGDPPLELFGRYWSDQLRNGEAALMALAPEEWMSVGFGDLMADPGAVVTRVTDFLGAGTDDRLAEEARRLVDPALPHRSVELEPGVRGRLEEACEPGREVLRRLGGGAT